MKFVFKQKAKQGQKHAKLPESTQSRCKALKAGAKHSKQGQSMEKGCPSQVAFLT